jgi:hypothetical protein
MWDRIAKRLNLDPKDPDNRRAIAHEIGLGKTK